MRTFKNQLFAKGKKSLILFLLFSSIAVLLAILQDNLQFASFAVQHITNPIKRVLGQLTSLVGFSLAEWVYGFLIIFVLVFVFHSVKKTSRAQKGEKPAIVVIKTINLITIALAVYIISVLSWGINYHTQSPVAKIGVNAQVISVDELEQATLLFIQKINEVAPQTQRDESGVFNAPKQEIFDASSEIYNNLQKQYPVLEWPSTKAKPMLFSRFMSELKYTGFYFGFTAEANVNDEQPLCFLPSTIAHELAHVRGVAPEQDANFLAVLSCETSGDINYIYSGYLLAYVHLSNALYSADTDKWQSAYEQLSDFVKADLQANNAYWAQFESPASDIADAVYETYLQSNGQEDGLASYGRVVDLLVDYYL